MNKAAHAIVLAFFGMACSLLWALLQLPPMVRLHGAEPNLPAFTRLCIGVGPTVLVGLATLAAAYCVWVWLGKAQPRNSWIGFLATATAVLFLITLPVIVAVYLPLISVIQNLPAK